MTDNLPGAVDLQNRAARHLYGSPAKSGSVSTYTHARTSLYDARRAHARQRKDVFEEKRLAAEEKEFAKLCGELGLTDAQALRLGCAIRDCSVTPLTREQMVELDQANLRERYGEAFPDVMQRAGTRSMELLKDKPHLRESIANGKAHLHVDVVETVADAVQAQHLAATAPAAPAPQE